MKYLNCKKRPLELLQIRIVVPHVMTYLKNWIFFLFIRNSYILLLAVYEIQPLPSITKANQIPERGVLYRYQDIHLPASKD
jgi:hypothetical protein